jgi:hypothetical protein
MNPAFIGLVSTSDKTIQGKGFIGSLSQVKDIINIYNIDEVIFCAKDLPAQNIIDTMSQLQDQQVDFKIAPPESLSIIGSNSISTTGDLYVIDINSIGKSSNQRNKRFLDLLVSFGLLPLFPILMWTSRQPLGFVFNLFRVLLGFRTWVGYNLLREASLPRIKKGILSPTDAFSQKTFDNETVSRLNMLYARDYKISSDLLIIWKGYRNMGRY